MSKTAQMPNSGYPTSMFGFLASSRQLTRFFYMVFIVQLAERLIVIQEIDGSNPPRHPTKRRIGIEVARLYV